MDFCIAAGTFTGTDQTKIPVVQALCKQELRSKPCPQTLLLCCNHIVANGLHTEGIFRSGMPFMPAMAALL
jgi:hypothetical protein